MSRLSLRGLTLVGFLVAATGCATSEDWRTWRTHPTHFASGEHGLFSLRNRAESAPHVNRTDVALARNEGWWGKPVTVSPEQILER
jgi:hypothetical protein